MGFGFRWFVLAALGAVSIQAFAEDTSLYPYKVVGQQVFFQRYSNEPAKLVAQATGKDFKLIYHDHKMAIGAANGHYFCDSLQLPQGLDISSASVLDSFLMTNVGAYAFCQPTVDINPNTFAALYYPFFRNGDQILLATGHVLAGADGTTFHSHNNQGYDKHRYYFIGGEHKSVAYQHHVTLFKDCYAWANVDGALYYEGELRDDIDTETFKCLDFYVAADTYGLLFHGQRVYSFSEKMDTNRLNMVKDNIVSDGQFAWFVGVEPYRFDGLDVSKLNVNGNMISDGRHDWRCQNYKQGNQPMCVEQ